MSILNISWQKVGEAVENTIAPITDSTPDVVESTLDSLGVDGKAAAEYVRSLSGNAGQQVTKWGEPVTDVAIALAVLRFVGPLGLAFLIAGCGPTSAQFYVSAPAPQLNINPPSYPVVIVQEPQCEIDEWEYEKCLHKAEFDNMVKSGSASSPVTHEQVITCKELACL